VYQNSIGGAQGVPFRLSRRDFLKLAGTTAFFASLDWGKVVKAAVNAARQGAINIVWFEAQDCAGNTTALIQATEPDLITILGGASHAVGPGTVRLVFHETVMLSWGEKTPSYAEDLVKNPEKAKQLIESLPKDDPLRKTLETFVKLGYNPGILLTSPIDILKLASEGKLNPFVLVIEGSIPVDKRILQEHGVTDVPDAVDYFCYIGEENGHPISCAEWIRRLLKHAVAVIAVGNCACYGGLIANKVLEKDFMKKMGYDLFEKWGSKGWSYSPTGAVGFFPDKRRGFKGFVDLVPEAEPFRRFVYGQCKLGPGEIRSDCRPAVAVPGCPANGNGQLRVIANMVLWALGQLPLPELDEYWRPKYIFGKTVHEQCPRAAWYAAGDFRKFPGENTAQCLYAVGCKGPISHCPWNKVGWVNGVGGPTRTGGICIGCTEPGFTDSFEPFYQKLPYVGASVEELKKDVEVGAAALIATGVLAGIWAHLRSKAKE
jgi:hydrogenase small subunit